MNYKTAPQNCEVGFFYYFWTQISKQLIPEMREDVDTQWKRFGSMESANNSILQVSSLHSASSFALVKGKAKLPQIHIMCKALRFESFPCGSRTTS